MGQAKRRGTLEDRIQQSVAADTERRELANIAQAEKREREQSEWDAMSPAEQEALRAERRRRRNNVRSILAVTALLASV